MKLLNSIQFLSLICLGVFTLLILGAEPNNLADYSEAEMNKTLFTLCYFWVGLLMTFIISTLVIVIKKQ